MKKFLIALLLLAACAGMAYGGYQVGLYDSGMESLFGTKAPKTSEYQYRNVHVNTGNAEKNNEIEQSVKPQTTDEPVTEKTTNITFAACGDNLINSYITDLAKANGKNGKYDFRSCYRSVVGFFSSRDLNWINQETLVSNTLPVSSYPKFSSPGNVAKTLYNANFRVFNISTNHTYDQGEKGINETLKFWNKEMKKDTLAVGLVKKGRLNDIPIKEVKGVSIAFLSYTYGTNGLTVSEKTKAKVIYLAEEKKIKKQVKLARKKADVVVVSCHWGNEDRHEVAENQKQMAKKITGWGADLIIGTHPHVIQDGAWIRSGKRKAFCVYSLGNFISGQNKPDNLVGAVLSCKISVTEKESGEKKVTIKQPELIPIVTDYRSGHGDVHVVWFRNYKKKNADSHGVRNYTSRFDYDYIKQVIDDNISRKFLHF